MTRPAPSTQLRNPTPDSTEAGKAIYVALLERRIIYYIVRDIKMRAALELATGVPYDSVNLNDLSSEDIAEIIAQDMSRGLNISVEDARARVSENRITANPV